MVLLAQLTVKIYNIILTYYITYIVLFTAPTILTDVVDTDIIMQQGIFGPVLPLLTVQNVDEAVAFINKQEKPLCVYAYSNNSKVKYTFWLCVCTVY